jgi:hypothetical protein
MSEGKSIVNLGELSKPATVLVEKIAEAVGGIFRPYQIKRTAKAEAEAQIIHAEAQIKITELQRRAVRRFVVEEAVKQQNMETITAHAVPLLTDRARPQAMEIDWITNFFNKCRIISDEEMQQLWARVLAGEANSPGIYSKRTVNFLDSLDKQDAVSFTKLCRFGWTIDEEFYPVVFNSQAQIYQRVGIDFNTLLHLDAIGLIRFDSANHFERLGLSQISPASYYGQRINFRFRKRRNNTLVTGAVLLTQIGEQLAPICDAKPIPKFFTYSIGQWRERSLDFSSPDLREIVELH